MLCGILFPLTGNAQDWKVLFSANGGFYEDVFELEMFSTYPQGRIFYTVNGNRPTVESEPYSEPLVLDESLYSSSDIYTINNSIPSQFYLADSVKHCIVIRAAVFDDRDSCVSPVTTQSYFIRALGCDLHGLPVMSIATDSLALFDYETGIFVPGINYDPADSLATGNFKMKGREWERLINLEFYETDNRGINQECGLRTHGGASRWFQQKGMKLYAREEYGKKRFSHRFFESTPISKFKHLKLHPFRCSNWLHTGGQEYLANNIARHLDIECMATRETVVFINGEYWGIYTLEESNDERYLEDHFDVDLEKVNMIKYWGVPHYGDPTEWREVLIWFQDADLTQPEDSAYAYSHIDVHNLIDYILFETFSANLDWPSNNTMFWQAETGSLFRWIFYDGDGCFTRPEFQAIEHALNQNVNSLVFQRFLENKSFCEAFRNRYNELSTSYLSYDFMKAILVQYGQIVEGEIDAQAHRFNFPPHRERWLTDMGKADQFLRQRDLYFREELKNFFGIEQPIQAPISCHPNPFTDEIRISIEAEQADTDEIAIYDLLGRKVFSAPCVCTEGTNGITLHPNLVPGLYVLKVGAYVTRLVRQ
jgi:hypothetical protein